MNKLQVPIPEEEIRKLKVGDEVLLTGTIMTARDAAHKYMVENPAEELNQVLDQSAIYHCGPVVANDGTESEPKWRFVAAGPTTSSREEPYQAKVIDKYQVRAVIGKGGMGEITSAGLKKTGAVYLHAIGGMAVTLADSVLQVKDVLKLKEFGVPEAMWIIEVKEFPAIVTMDSHGNSLHKKILKSSGEKYQQLMG